MKRDATGTILVLKPKTEKEYHHQTYGEHVEEWNVIL